jgi:3-hydroxyacyl-[acyl-carrier-protein] dehydratase
MVELKRSLDINEIQEIIPHRPPFLLIDRVIDTDSKTYVTAIKNVTMNEEFFRGHFPGAPIMPGVLIIEAMAQAAAIVVMANPDNKGKIPYFMSIDKVKFRKPVVPGDQVEIKIELIRMRETTGKAQATATVDGKVVAEAILAFVAAAPPQGE